MELTIALVGTALTALESDGAPYAEGFGTPELVGELFLTRFLVAFEIASLLLLIAAVGAVILARRRTGLPEAGESLGGRRHARRDAAGRRAGLDDRGGLAAAEIAPCRSSGTWSSRR